MQFAFTQNIKPIPEQSRKIAEIFTPKYVIESSKPISIMKEQDSVIKVRDIQIKDLKAKIEALKKEHITTLTEIATQNRIAQEASQEEDSISDDLLRKEKLKWTGIHLYVGTEVLRFNFESMSFNSELMFEFNRLHLGLKAEASDLRLENTYTFNYFIKIKYKIF